MAQYKIVYHVLEEDTVKKRQKIINVRRPNKALRRIIRNEGGFSLELFVNRGGWIRQEIDLSKKSREKNQIKALGISIVWCDIFFLF